MSIRASIVGGSGYLGGELIRMLTMHPQVELAQVSSRSLIGRYLHNTHPNMRGHSDLRYCHADDLENCDVLFLALPHGEVAANIEEYAQRAERIIDCAAV